MDKSKKIAIIIGIVVAIIAVIAIVAVVVLNNNSEEEETTDKSDKQTVQDNKENKQNKEEENNDNEKDKENEDMNDEAKNPIVTMKIKDYGTVKIELYPDVAPNTVANFISLIKERYYDGLTFHRIIDGFMIQGGDKAGSSSGETDFTIPGEFSANKYKNNLKHEKGVISMARRDYTGYGKTTEGYNSAATQFFIMLEDTESLDGLYASFGKVTEGIDIIEKIGKVDTDSNDKPKKAVVIESVTVDTFGKDYGEPERLEPFDINAYIMDLYQR